MYISSISIYPSISYRGNSANKNIVSSSEKKLVETAQRSFEDLNPFIRASQEKQLAKQAKEELEMIKAQGKKAGTDAAWWRPGFAEAVSTLEKIARGESLDEKESKNYDSTLADFYSYGEDGFI